MKMVSRRSRLSGALTAFALLAILAQTGDAGTLGVRVLRAADGQPISGAFVQIGPAPGVPFAANGGTTAADGRILFSDPNLIGPQTVTAAATDFARVSLMDSVVDSITVRLRPTVASGGLVGPTAEVSGTVTNIATSSNDGNFDMAIVYPAVDLSSLLAGRNFPIEIPADTVNFPVIGEVVLPGNVVLPSQTEFFVLNFSKPNYHFSIGDGATYDFMALAGRLPIDAISGPDPQNAITMREIGAERNIAVSGPRVLTINSDLNLTNNLTVNVPEAPNGSETQAFSLADFPGAGGTKTIFFDLKSGLADTQDSFLLSGRNAGGDLGDAAAYVAAVYADSSVDARYSAGRVDRTPLTLPATRTVGAFFLLPSLSQAGAQYQWSNVERPGITPAPTWAVASFRLEAATTGDPGVVTQSLWEVWATAGSLAFTLPVLPGSAPGGLVDPSETGDADRLVWDQRLADPAGSLAQVLVDPFRSATRYSQRWIEVTPAAAAVELVQTDPGRGLRLEPNPLSSNPSLHWGAPPIAGSQVAWLLLDVTGRQRARGQFLASGSVRDPLPGSAMADVASGTYWFVVHAGGRSMTTKCLVVR